MRIYRLSAEMTGFIDNQRKTGQKIGFVPTMGALHQGHISLINESKNDNNLTICSIFVNPTQFNNAADFQKYPITIENDINLLELAGCDILFLPSIEEIYPTQLTKEHYDLGSLETILEGKYRPGHFQGVCLVVDRLLSIIHCDDLYLGQKDYQQCMVIEKLVELKNYDLKMHFCETIRENDGLAMSSRNARLNESERIQATAIYDTFLYIKNNIPLESLDGIKKTAQEALTSKGFIVDYVALTNEKLEPLDIWDGKSTIVALVAAYLNEVRLIDNMIVA